MNQHAAVTDLEDLPLAPLPPGHEPFVVDLDGFDGPVDLLLELATQYINYIEHAKDLRLEVAADYLVMAAWLTYLKSRLLLPEQPNDDEQLTPQDLADILAFQLRRLQSMRRCGEDLMNRPRLGRDFFKPANRNESFVTKQLQFDLKFHDLINAYGRILAEKQAAFYQPKQRKLFKMEDAIERLATMIGLAKEWISIDTFMPIDEIEDYLVKKSAVSSTFSAFLELAKQGQVFLKQERNFGPIFMRARAGASEEEND